MGIIRRIARKLLGRGSDSGSPSEVLPSAPRPEQPPVADGEALASMECGAQELRERIEAGETVLLLDVREPFETDTGIIPDALLIPLRELSTRWEELKDANEIVCYCASGARSYNAAMLLRTNGLINATSLEGGMAAWRAIGAPVDKPEAG
ncbi:MAG: rhodanese-related sulfurtransferase [Myxococcota bacterium]|jgi:rhodanese-related sulfurtransferase